MSESDDVAGSPPIPIRSDEMPESPKTTIRWDDGMKADAERVIKERGISSIAEFDRQAVRRFIAWCDAQKQGAKPPLERRKAPR